MASLQQYADSQLKKTHNQTLFCAREPIDVRLIKHLDGEQAIYIDHKLVIIPEQPGMPHRHAYIEFACILEGECDQMIEGESVHLCAGDAIIVDQNCQHMEAYTGKTLCIVWLGLRREFLIDEVLGGSENNCAFFKCFNGQGLTCPLKHLNTLIADKKPQVHIYVCYVRGLLKRNSTKRYAVRNNVELF